MERFFLRAPQNPIADFLKSCFFSADGTYTYRVQGSDVTNFVQVQMGSRSVALSYGITSQESGFTRMIETLCQIGGEAGKFHLVANVPAESDQWHYLKTNGFHTYSVQTIWRVAPVLLHKSSCSAWTFEKTEDQTSIASFYSHILSPLEISLQSWKFPNIFHLVLYDNPEHVCGVTRVLFFDHRALLFPMLDVHCADPAQCITALLQDCSKYFSDIFLCECTAHPLPKGILGTNAEVCLSENHRMVRNLAASAAVKDFQPAELLKEQGIARPSTPCSHS